MQRELAKSAGQASQTPDPPCQLNPAHGVGRPASGALDTLAQSGISPDQVAIDSQASATPFPAVAQAQYAIPKATKGTDCSVK
jgi:hypothetical protein